LGEEFQRLKRPVTVLKRPVQALIHADDILIIFCYYFYLPNLVEISFRMMYTPGQGGDNRDRA